MACDDLVREQSGVEQDKLFAKNDSSAIFQSVLEGAHKAGTSVVGVAGAVSQTALGGAADISRDAAERVRGMSLMGVPGISGRTSASPPRRTSAESAELAIVECDEPGGAPA